MVAAAQFHMSRSMAVHAQRENVQEIFKPLPRSRSTSFLQNGPMALGRLNSRDLTTNYRKLHKSLVRHARIPSSSHTAVDVMSKFARHGVVAAEFDIIKLHRDAKRDNKYATIRALSSCKELGFRELIGLGQNSTYGEYKHSVVSALVKHAENFPNSSIGKRERVNLNKFVNAALQEAIKDRRLDRIENVLRLTALTRKIDPIGIFKTMAEELPELVKNAWYWDESCERTKCINVVARTMVQLSKTPNKELGQFIAGNLTTALQSEDVTQIRNATRLIKLCSSADAVSLFKTMAQALPQFCEGATFYNAEQKTENCPKALAAITIGKSMLELSEKSAELFNDYTLVCLAEKHPGFMPELLQPLS